MVYIYNRILFILKKEGNPTICDNMDGTELSEVSQSQKDKYCMILLYEVSKIVKLPEAENRMVAAREWRGGEIGKLCSMCIKLPQKKKKKKTTPTNYIYTHHFDKSRGGKPKTLENSALLSATWEKKTA